MAHDNTKIIVPELTDPKLKVITKINEFLALAQEMGVEASVLGEFTDSGLFEVVHGETALAHLDLLFLHEGLSRMKIKAHFEGPKKYQEYHREFEDYALHDEYTPYYLVHRILLIIFLDLIFLVM